MRRRVVGGKRERVVRAAGNRCGYCLTPQRLSNTRLEVEHTRPVARGGTSDESNLWLACSTCNTFKGDAVSGVDPETGRRVRLFDPRRQDWDRHFGLVGVRIVGRTPTGRAAVETLRLNDPLHLDVREFWISVGAFP
jgi:hypothetical protein